MSDGNFSADDLARLGLEDFLAQKYEQAAAHFKVAVEKSPGNLEWQRMLSKSEANAKSEIQNDVPKPYLFDRTTLLTPASPIKDVLPSPPPKRVVIFGERVRRAVGTLLGKIVTFLVELVTTIYGSLFGYRGKIWTNW